MTAEPGHFAFAHRLDLTADQMEKIKTERLKTEKQLIQDMADMQKMHLDLRAEATQDKPDMDKLEKLTRQMGEQHAKIIMEHTKSMIFFRSLLTPEQKKKFDTMSTHMGGFGEGRHRMGRKGAGKQEKQCESK
jgi:Spy/CpxP family protein refolding chaperone